MRIIVAGYIDVTPENRDRTLRDAKPFIDAALNEPGCIAYDWTADTFNPQRIQVFEEWEVEEQLAFHLREQPYLDMAGHLGKAGILGSQTKKYRVDHSEPVYDPSGVPRADFFTAPK